MTVDQDPHPQPTHRRGRRLQPQPCAHVDFAQDFPASMNIAVIVVIIVVFVPGAYVTAIKITKRCQARLVRHLTCVVL